MMYDADSLKSTAYGTKVNQQLIMVKEKPVIDKLREQLPAELQLTVAFFLSPRDLVLTLKSLSRYWRKFATD
jgi:hypothetical protein